MRLTVLANRIKKTSHAPIPRMLVIFVSQGDCGNMVQSRGTIFLPPPKKLINEKNCSVN